MAAGKTIQTLAQKSSMVFIQLNILPIPRKLINLFLNFKGFLKKKHKGEEVSIGLVACPQIGGKYN